MIACIILNYNDSENTLNLLHRIYDFDALDVIIIIDNCSTDDSWERIQEVRCDRVHICKTEKNGGYGYGNNYGVRYAKSIGCDFALIANPDVFFDNSLVQKFKSVLEQNERYSVVSGIQRDIRNNEIIGTAWKIPRIWSYIFSTGFLFRRFADNYYYSLAELHSREIFPVDCVAGALLMVSVVKFIECGGYDEEMFLYCEESTLGYKMRKVGYCAAICSNISYKHIHGQTIEKNVCDAVKRKSVLLKSHHLFLDRYLGANQFQLIVDLTVGKVVLLEEKIITYIVQRRRENC